MTVCPDPKYAPSTTPDLPSLRTLAGRILRDREARGTTLLEFALTLPPLLTVVAGILVFGLTMSDYVFLTNATNIGARAIAISRGVTTDPCQLGSSAVFKSAPTMYQSQFTFAYQFNGVSYSGTSCNVLTSSAAGNLVQGQPITVTVTYPCRLGVYNHNYLPSCQLNAQITELVQ